MIRFGCRAGLWVAAFILIAVVWGNDVFGGGPGASGTRARSRPKGTVLVFRPGVASPAIDELSTRLAAEFQAAGFVVQVQKESDPVRPQDHQAPVALCFILTDQGRLSLQLGLPVRKGELRSSMRQLGVVAASEDIKSAALAVRALEVLRVHLASPGAGQARSTPPPPANPAARTIISAVPRWRLDLSLATAADLGGLKPGVGAGVGVDWWFARHLALRFQGAAPFWGAKSERLQSGGGTAVASVRALVLSVNLLWSPLAYDGSLPSLRWRPYLGAGAGFYGASIAGHTQGALQARRGQHMTPVLGALAGLRIWLSPRFYAIGAVNLSWMTSGLRVALPGGEARRFGRPLLGGAVGGGFAF